MLKIVMYDLHLKADIMFCGMAVIDFLLFVWHFSCVGEYYYEFSFKRVKNYPSEWLRIKTIMYVLALS